MILLSVAFYKRIKIDTTDVRQIVIQLEDEYEKYVNESHITSSTNKKEVFRYLLQEIDESSRIDDISCNWQF